MGVEDELRQEIETGKKLIHEVAAAVGDLKKLIREEEKRRSVFSREAKAHLATFFGEAAVLVAVLPVVEQLVRPEPFNWSLYGWCVGASLFILGGSLILIPRRKDER